MKKVPQSLFISHGGGPLPLLGDALHKDMVVCLENIAASFPRPKALVVFSAHWEAEIPTITAGRNPGLIYDYYGFPQESYEIEYPCSGYPSLAREIHNLLAEGGITSVLDTSRGFDHGVFVPLKIMYPEANIPCVQVSLVNSLDPEIHIRIGEALSVLSARDDVLLIGSGFSFHNMRAFFSKPSTEEQRANALFEKWLMSTCSDKKLSENDRWHLLSSWAKAPGAIYCHPREEHLLPLHVCYGAAKQPCMQSYELNILNKESSMFMW